MFVEVRNKIASEISSGLAFEELRALHEIDRWFTSPAFDKSARHLAARWKSFGLSSKVERFPADGRARVASWVMPYAWDVNDAVLAIDSPAALKGTVLARYRERPTALAMWSGPTPKKGLVAQLVYVPDAANPNYYDTVDVRGKIVFTSVSAVSAKGLAARHGAVGILSDFNPEPRDLPDASFWSNAMSDDPGGWGLKLDESRIFGFNITPRDGLRLRDLLKTHGPLTLRAVVDSRIYKGTLPAVTAVIPGLQRNEEVLAIGHAFEQGANDNASGVAAMLEAARALTKLIAEGALPRPRRTIRFLAVSECYTTFAYAEKYAPKMARTVAAALCLDSVAEKQDLCRTMMAVHRPPDANASYVTAFAERLADVTFAPWRAWFRWLPRPYGTTDNVINDPLIGPPTIYLGQYPKDLFWHTSADTLDKVDVELLAKVAEYAAAYLYVLASAGTVDALYFAALAAARAKAELSRSAALTLEACRDAGMAPDAARARTVYSSEIGAWEVQSVRALLRLKEARTIRAELARLSNTLLEDGQRYAGELERVLSVCRHEHPAPKPDPEREALRLRAASLVPRRKFIGSMALDFVPLEKRGPFEDPRWNGDLTAALFWCDGKRTLAELLDLAGHELRRDLTYLVPLFEFLTANSLIDLTKS